ncbi:MAG: AIR synthase-related protein [Candidatus Promineifilaceae bacterium]|jgi:phosphoribosylformylglycinamidine cyclo-ligase
MPGVYQPGKLDLVGTILGVAEQERIIDGSRIEVGDAILGLPSSGLHTNGYTLARTVLGDLDWFQPLPEIGGSTIGEALLAPHRSYLSQVFTMFDGGLDLRGLAHITGGGLIDNPVRILPENVDCVLRSSAWRVPPIFNLIQKHGDVSSAEMAHVFNLGLGMLLFLPQQQVDEARHLVPEAVWVGEVQEGARRVRFQA